MKTFILVWTQKVKNLHSDDVNNFFGLGDLLRGAISMFQLSKKYNFHFFLDVQLHPISQFLKYNKHPYSDMVLQNKDDIPFIYPDDIEDFLSNSNFDSGVSYLLTNSHLIGEITQECKKFIKNVLNPTDEFERYINDIKVSKNTPENYNILHFRLGDSLLIRNENNIDFQHFINIMNNNREHDDILMSDSIRFKEHIMTNYHDVRLFHIHVAHMGYIHHVNNIKDTLFEFFVVTRAKKIKTFTVYGHISGFVHIAHLIYDIPLIRI